jgi:ferredoxin
MDIVPASHIGVRCKAEPDSSVRQVAFIRGVTLREILNSSSLRVRSACAGIGGCGLCRVRIDTGRVGPPTLAEVVHLGEEAIAEGTRLACQIVPETSLDVTVLSSARPSPWRSPILGPYRPSYPIPAKALDSDVSLGVAVDLGTTNITVAVCDLAAGGRIAVRTGANPQTGLCADVIGRLHMAEGRHGIESRCKSWRKTPSAMPWPICCVEKVCLSFGRAGACGWEHCDAGASLRGRPTGLVGSKRLVSPARWRRVPPS